MHKVEKSQNKNIESVTEILCLLTLTTKQNHDEVFKICKACNFSHISTTSVADRKNNKIENMMFNVSHKIIIFFLLLINF